MTSMGDDLDWILVLSCRENTCILDLVLVLTYMRMIGTLESIIDFY